MSILYTGQPMPQDGKFNGREAAQRARAMECLRDGRSIQDSSAHA
jgi:hypothetical protein